MSRVLYKIKDPKEDLGNLNVNFDRIALDLSDKSGTFSSTASFSGTIPASTTLYAEVNILDLRDSYQFGKVPFIPRIDAYVDVDDDLSYLYPVGGNITQQTLHGLFIEMMQTITPTNLVDNEKATIFIVMRNRDTDPHDLYITLDGFYVPSPEVGIAERES